MTRDRIISLKFLTQHVSLNQVQARVQKLRENANQDSTAMQQGFGKIQVEAIGANGRLNSFITSADVSSVKDSAALAAKVSRMEENLLSW